MPLHGCITTGEVWQFLRLQPPDVLIDRRRFYLNELADILGALITIAQDSHVLAS
jgi:hypothetical protein